MKLTLFTLPKPFAEPFGTIQHNALRSWCALRPAPEVLLFGDEQGTAEAAALHCGRHIPVVRRNDLGTPLVDHLFGAATRHTSTPYQCFVNADIILDPALTGLLDEIVAWRPRVLVVSRRWDIDVHETLDFNTAATFQRLAVRARTEGRLYPPFGMDVFVFPTGFFDHMPPFSIGWPGAKYDNWLIWAARRARIPVIDVTPALTNVHQNHPGGAGDPAKAREHWINLDLLGGHGCCYDILDATHVIDSRGTIVRRRRSWPERRRDLFRLAQRWRYRIRRDVFRFRYAPHMPAANTARHQSHSW